MRNLLEHRFVRGLLCVAVFLIALAATYNCLLFSDWSSISGGYDVYRETDP